jgi:molybdate transport system ATP-binding protein
VDEPAARAHGRAVIEARVHLPLARFSLRVDLRLGRGVTALMGPSGSGKTSLLEAIAGLRPSARGRIGLEGTRWLDTDAGIHLAPNRRRVGYVPQDAGLFPHLTVLGNVRFGVRDEAAAKSAIETLEIGHLLDRYPVALSGGERQRVALARALATRPELLLLDEPLASLDAALRHRILPYLVRVRDEWQVPCLYVTHNVGEALAVAEWLVVLQEGAVRASGPPRDLLAAAAIDREADFGLENLLPGRVTTHDTDAGVTRVALAGGASLSVCLAPQHAPGRAVTLSVRAEDVLVAVEPLRGLSARNVFEARVAALDRTGADVTLQCTLGDRQGGPTWFARVTPAATAALGLAPGTAVWLAVKSHSVRIVE